MHVKEPEILNIRAKFTRFESKTQRVFMKGAFEWKSEDRCYCSYVIQIYCQYALAVHDSVTEPMEPIPDILVHNL